MTGPRPMEPHVRDQVEQLSRLPQPRELTLFELARIERGLPGASTRRRGSARWLRTAIAVGGALLAPLALAAAAVAVYDSYVRPRAVRPAPPAAPTPVAPAVELPAPPALPAPVAPPPVPSAAAVRPTRPTRGPASRPAAVPARAAEPEETLSAESSLLSVALRQLRQEHAPAEALRTLDAYRAQFPDGQLRRESELARLDVLLALGERGRALEELERMEAPLAGTPRATELGVLQAELLYEAARPSDALRLLDRLLAGALPPALEERALIARATCRIATGHPQAAREDLRRYLERYPNGRFAQKARAQLPEE